MSGVTRADTDEFAKQKSFIELSARRRAQMLLDSGTFLELLDPFDRISSPWLPRQGIVPQSDDGAVIARGKIDGHPAVVLAIEGGFQGGSIGEVSGMKMATALELALADNQQGIATRPVLLLETAGVRLQEANLGLAVVAEIQASIIALREYIPVVAVIAGMVGCFGGMALSAALCSYVIMTRQGRLGMNGPEVIEQEAGIEEFDSADKQMIWSIDGGEQRYETGFADVLVNDDIAEMTAAVKQAFNRGLLKEHRSAQVERYLHLLAGIDTSNQVDPKRLRELWKRTREL
ncbi:MAG: biotin-independent malonate decarboxylase subunit beta [Bryobacteraceae bacterium]